ncbi:MAG: hypothetical protein OHK93_006779 [Ramalina farinacea]|uniref:Uncharacterized protein n=1 Tax=Ramalina farinacea TaxID=258253 RepID=A0AA43QKW3_9LECA|nr:hypothetical protein [Ramalina farinacea]
MCKYVSTAPTDCIGAFMCPSVGVHEHTQCHTCAEARRPGRSECGQNVNNTEIHPTLIGVVCFPPVLEFREDDSRVGSVQGDGTVSGSAINKGSVVNSGSGGPHGNPVEKSTRTVNESFTGNPHGHVSNKGTPPLNGNAAGASNGNGIGGSTGKAPTVPSMAWIKERGKELMMVKEAAMARETAMTKGTMKPGPIEGSGNKGGIAREAVMTPGTAKPGSIEGSGNKGAMAREAAMTSGTVKPGSVEGTGNKDIAKRVSHH